MVSKLEPWNFRQVKTVSERYAEITQRLVLGKIKTWFVHVESILRASNEIVDEMLVRGRSVVVHCSDGWDRTPQTVCLACLCMDPYYRTFDGFKISSSSSGSSSGTNSARAWAQRMDAPTQNRARNRPYLSSGVTASFSSCLSFQTILSFARVYSSNLSTQCTAVGMGNFLFDSERERVQVHRTRRVTTSCWHHLTLGSSGIKIRAFVRPRAVKHPCAGSQHRARLALLFRRLFLSL